MGRENPNLLKFLIASAVYRDGLNGVFAYGAVLGGIAFGLSLTEIILFGIAANLVAGFGAFVGAFIEDRIGSRLVVFISLAGVIIGGFGVFVFADLGTVAFFGFGLFLCTFVGPAQAASRTMMSRLSTDDRQGEAFGLYATTGRSVSFLAPAAWTAFVGLLSPIWGIIGLMKTVAMELGPHGIRANAICPGCVEGSRIDGVIEREAKAKGTIPQFIRAAYEQGVSMRSFVTAEDVAAMALFLAYDGARLVSGQAIAVDGHTENPDPKV
jgi:NAD(P)-dependent dehydrogenase (short-subunit alcohol dehydrogenase family)